MDLYIEALIDLHHGLKRQGPGDDDFSKMILSKLPALPKNPRIVDMGCGSGAGALLLAEWYQTQLLALDFSRPFLDDLETFSKERNLDHLIHIAEGDMGDLDWPEKSLDLIWSEGAAYNLTFEGALKYWRPLLKTGGIAVISEISWFTKDISDEALTFWQTAYPQMATEENNRLIAQKADFEVLDVHRLPSESWWENYYNPLKERMENFESVLSPALGQVLEETEAEMNLFRKYSDEYGYSFYLLKAAE